VRCSEGAHISLSASEGGFARSSAAPAGIDPVGRRLGLTVGRGAPSWLVPPRGCRRRFTARTSTVRDEDEPPREGDERDESNEREEHQRDQSEPRER